VSGGSLSGKGRKKKGKKEEGKGEEKDWPAYTAVKASRDIKDRN